MKIESKVSIPDMTEQISIFKRVEPDRASVTASIESKRVGLVNLIKRDSIWTIVNFYTDRTYDSSGNLTRRLYNSIGELSIQKGVRPIDNLEEIVRYMEKD